MRLAIYRKTIAFLFFIMGLALHKNQLKRNTLLGF